MCRKNPAKKIEARQDNRLYLNAAKEPIFCSVRCAANWALVRVLDDDPIWSDEQERWFNAGDAT